MTSGVVVGDEHRGQLRDLRRAASRYHDFEKAEADGYELISPCVAHPTLGAMGFHAGKMSLVDEVVSPDEPEVLVYEQTDDGFTLVAAEFVSMAEDRPELFGEQFHEAPHLPWNWDLHVWAWKHNPSGMFAPFNPRVSCPE